MGDTKGAIANTGLQTKVFPGPLSEGNKKALEWGANNLLAYGCHSYVVVVDAGDLKPIQTLDEHRAHVTSIKWPRQAFSATTEKDFALQLASADALGTIIVWNVLEASVIAHFALSDLSSSSHSVSSSLSSSSSSTSGTTSASSAILSNLERLNPQVQMEFVPGARSGMKPK